MKSVSKFAAKLPLLCAVICAFLLISAICIFAFPATANASSTTFEVIYPKEGYFPASDARLIAANGSHIAVYDAASGNIFVTSENGKSLSRFDVSSHGVITGIWLSGNTLLVGSTANDTTSYYAGDVSKPNHNLSAVTLPSPVGISYIVADDEHIYAKSDNEIAVYSNVFSEGGLSLEKIIDDKYIQGKYIFTANDGMLYFYAQNYSNRQYFIYDADADSLYFMRPDATFLPTYVAYCDYGIVMGMEESICIVDVENGSDVLLDTKIPYSSSTVFAAYGTSVYVVNDNGGVDEYTVDLTESNVSLVRTLSMSGTGDGRFDSPSDVLITTAGLVVADSGNSRISVADGTSFRYVYTDEAPLRLTVSAQGMIYAASENLVYAVTASADGTLVAGAYCGIPDGEKIKDIAYVSNMLVILTDGGVYLRATALGQAPVKVMDTEGGIALTAARNDVLYLMTADGIFTLSASGISLTELIAFRAFSFAGATDIAADYAGNLFVSWSDGRITSLKNDISGLTESASFELENSLYAAVPAAITLDGSRAVFASSTCFIGRAEVGATDESSYVPLPAPDPDNATALTFAILGKDTYLFDEPGRFDTMSAAAQGTVVLCYEGVSAQEGYTFVYFGGKTGYISDGDLIPTTAHEINATYTLAAHAPIYTHPAAQTSTSLSADALVTVTDDAATLDEGAWVRILYGGKTYFTSADNVTEYVEIVPEKEKVYGRASAERAGGLVSVYSLPDSSTEPVLEVVDGTRMEILDESGDFWLVSVENTVGYVLKSDVELEGLTTVQIVSIVLCCAVAVTGAVVFIVTWQARKKEKENK